MKLNAKKERNRQVKQEAIIAAAKTIFQDGGIEKLTMREIAQHIGYSLCIIYQHFSSKESILKALFQEVSRELVGVLSQVKSMDNSEEYLIMLFLKDIEFMLEKPFRVELFKTVIGGLKREEYPTAMREIAAYFGQALKALGYQCLSNQKEIDAALDILRAMLSGVLNMAFRDGSAEGMKRSLTIMEDGIRVLLEGWKIRSAS